VSKVLGEFYVIRDTQTRVPGAGDCDPIYCEKYDSEADFLKAFIDYLEELITDLDNNTNYFEDEDGMEALKATKQHLAKLTKHLSDGGETPLKPEDYGFYDLWFYWIEVYIATENLEEYAKYLFDKLCEYYEGDDLNNCFTYCPMFEYLNQVYVHKKPFDKEYFLSNYGDFENHSEHISFE
jgi:exonuclease VII small subunit